MFMLNHLWVRQAAVSSVLSLSSWVRFGSCAASFYHQRSSYLKSEGRVRYLKCRPSNLDSRRCSGVLGEYPPIVVE